MTATLASSTLARRRLVTGRSVPARPAAPRRYFTPDPDAVRVRRRGATRGASRGATRGNDPLGLGGLRLTQRGRLVLVALAVLVSAPVAGLGARAVASGPPEPVEVVAHTVAPGETLWGFARALAGPGEDLRPVVARIQSLNALDSAALRIGQTILLPAT